MSNTEKIFIILPVYNRRIITEKFIKCLIKQTWENFQLILVDDGSNDGTADMVISYLPETIFITGKGSWWWGGALQQGINWLKTQGASLNDFVLMINDDVMFSPDFLSDGIALIRGHLRTLVLAQIIDEKTGMPVESGVTADLVKQTFSIAQNENSINCFSTRGLMLRFCNILEIGNFHPRLLPHYGSDYEYTIRAHKKGFKFMTSPSFFLEMDRSETGLHSLPDVNLLEFIKNFFSKRYVGNPIYRSSFIALTAPLGRRPILIFGIWNKMFTIIFRKIRT